MKFAHSTLEGIMATAIVIMYEQNELTYAEALNALELESGMTRVEAISFIRSNTGDQE